MTTSLMAIRVARFMTPVFAPAKSQTAIRIAVSFAQPFDISRVF